jgi:serine/threonine protein kinase
MAPSQISAITNQVADALDYIHRCGAIHRDVKPANVMVGDTGRATLLDFGIVRAADGTRYTTVGGIMGTPQYMSPEQAEGKELDHRSDVYALGIMVYQMCTGQVPFDDNSPVVVLRMQADKAPPPPDMLNPTLPEPVAQVLLKALDKAPESRYQQAGAFARALQEAVALAEQPRHPVETWAPPEEDLPEDVHQVAEERVGVSEPVKVAALPRREKVPTHEIVTPPDAGTPPDADPDASSVALDPPGVERVSQSVAASTSSDTSSVSEGDAVTSDTSAPPKNSALMSMIGLGVNLLFIGLGFINPLCLAGVFVGLIFGIIGYRNWEEDLHPKRAKTLGAAAIILTFVVVLGAFIVVLF